MDGGDEPRQLPQGPAWLILEPRREGPHAEPEDQQHRDHRGARHPAPGCLCPGRNRHPALLLPPGPVPGGHLPHVHGGDQGPAQAGDLLHGYGHRGHGDLHEFSGSLRCPKIKSKRLKNKSIVKEKGALLPFLVKANKYVVEHVAKNTNILTMLLYFQ